MCAWLFGACVAVFARPRQPRGSRCFGFAWFLLFQAQIKKPQINSKSKVAKRRFPPSRSGPHQRMSQLAPSDHTVARIG